jgi:hypothetical protein
VQRSDPPAHTSLYGVSQFAFETDDVSTLKQELIERDVPIIWEFENEELGAKFLFIRDPDGNLIQFLQKLSSPDASFDAQTLSDRCNIRSISE